MNNNTSMMRHIWLVRMLSALLGLMQLVYFTLSWLAPEPTQVGSVAMSFYPRGMDPGAVAGLAPGLRWAGSACALPALLLLGYALLRLDRMLQACAGGQIVVASMMHEARRIAEDNEGFV